MVRPSSRAIRAANRARLVSILRQEGAATRAQLAEATRLSRATVSSLVNELMRAGLVREERTTGQVIGKGRPRGSLMLNRAAGIAIGVDIGVRHVAVAVGDLSRQVLVERWLSMPRGHDADRATPIVMGCIEEALAEADINVDEVVGAAISTAAPVLRETGPVARVSGQLHRNTTRLAALVAERWGIPVAVENDANLGALGESVWGDFGGASSVLYVKIASGLGLGTILDGAIYGGSSGVSGELGHLVVEPDGVVCWCGRRGCLETVVGGDALLRKLDIPNPSDFDLRDLGSVLTSDHALAVVDHAATMLAQGIHTIGLLLDPDVIIVGGELAALGDRLLGRTRSAIEELPFSSRVKLHVSSLGDRASLVGALAYVLSDDDRFTDNTSGTALDAALGRARPS